MEQLYTLIGVIIGALVAICSPIIVSQIQERKRAKQLLEALLHELRGNEYVARTVKECDLPFDYLSNKLGSASYEQAKASGILASLPTTIINSLIGTYEITARFKDMIGRPLSIKQREQFARIYKTLPKRFNSSAQSLVQHIGDTKKAEEGDRPAWSEETDQKLVRSILNKVLTIPSPEWVDKYLFRALFVAAVLAFVTTAIYGSYQIPLGPNYTEAMRASFVFGNLAALVGLMGSYWFIRNRRLALFVTIAIELFLSDIFFQLVVLIEKAH